MASDKTPGCFAFCVSWKKSFSERCSSVRKAFRSCFGRRSSRVDHDDDQPAITTVSLTVTEDKESATVPEAVQATDPATVPEAEQATEAADVPETKQATEAADVPETAAATEPVTVPVTVPETAPVEPTGTDSNISLTSSVLSCLAEAIVTASLTRLKSEEGAGEE